MKFLKTFDLNFGVKLLVYGIAVKALLEVIGLFVPIVPAFAENPVETVKNAVKPS